MADDVVIDGLKVGGVMSALATTVWWIIRGAHRRIDGVHLRVTGVENEVSQTKLDLANHKIYAEGTYVKGISLDRIHSRIDDVSKKIDDILKMLVQERRSHD